MPSPTSPCFYTRTLTSPHAYIHFNLLSSPIHLTSPSPDILTLHASLVAALTQYLGLHGAAIPFDILKAEGSSVWIRVPKEDARGVLAAVGQWESAGKAWRVRGVGGWMGAAEGKGVWG